MCVCFFVIFFVFLIFLKMTWVSCTQSETRMCLWYCLERHYYWDRMGTHTRGHWVGGQKGWGHQGVLKIYLMWTDHPREVVGERKKTGSGDNWKQLMPLKKYLCSGLLYKMVSWCWGSGRPCHMALALSWLARPSLHLATSWSPVGETTHPNWVGKGS